MVRFLKGIDGLPDEDATLYASNLEDNGFEDLHAIVESDLLKLPNADWKSAYGIKDGHIRRLKLAIHELANPAVENGFAAFQPAPRSGALGNHDLPPASQACDEITGDDDDLGEFFHLEGMGNKSHPQRVFQLGGPKEKALVGKVHVPTNVEIDQIKQAIQAVEAVPAEDGSQRTGCQVSPEQKEKWRDKFYSKLGPVSDYRCVMSEAKHACLGYLLNFFPVLVEWEQAGHKDKTRGAKPVPEQPEWTRSSVTADEFNGFKARCLSIYLSYSLVPLHPHTLTPSCPCALTPPCPLGASTTPCTTGRTNPRTSFVGAANNCLKRL